MNYKIPFVNYPRGYEAIKEEIDTAIQGVLSQGDLILREEVGMFEKELAGFLRVKYVVGVNSGTDALLLSLKTTGIKQGDEVITSAHTFWATLEAIIHAGAHPVLADIDGEGLIDATNLAPISSKTKAIIPVHIAGQVCDMKAVEKMKDECEFRFGTSVAIIEDAAQALGASRDEKKAGTWGMTGCFSFYPAKILGAYGDAGAVATNDEKLYSRLLNLRNHGGKPNAVEPGYNSRLDNLQAAILRVKLKYLPVVIQRRTEIASIYDQKLEELRKEGLLRLPYNRLGRVYQDYIVGTERHDDLRGFLSSRGIETMINEYRFGPGFPKPLLTSVWERDTLRLPCYPELTDEEVYEVIKAIKLFFKR